MDDQMQADVAEALEQPDWANTGVAREGREDPIRRLKPESGKATNIQGSTTIVQSVAQAA